MLKGLTVKLRRWRLIRNGPSGLKFRPESDLGQTICWILVRSAYRDCAATTRLATAAVRDDDLPTAVELKSGLVFRGERIPLINPHPVASGRLLSRDQIRWGLDEEIRVEGARSAMSQRNSYDVNRFNIMVADHKSRCGSFRYRSDALKSVRSEVESKRNMLLAEGFARFQFH